MNTQGDEFELENMVKTIGQQAPESIATEFALGKIEKSNRSVVMSKSRWKALLGTLLLGMAIGMAVMVFMDSKTTNNQENDLSNEKNESVRPALKTNIASPFGLESDICPKGNNQPYSVDGFQGTPFVIIPFVNNFVNPPVTLPSRKACRTDGHCVFAYSIDIVDTVLRPFDQSIPACANLPPTKFITYNGKTPGPTLIIPTGHESVVRFNNKIRNFFTENVQPCTGNRRGRPISVHLHGSSSTATFDGWAEDETCVGETKEYVYPNNRPATQWYHDHALHTTANNAYFGLAGFYVVSSKVQYGGCGEPWNLENIEERYMILQDKVLDSQCQLFFDPDDVHKTSLYGDINLISGIPFPNMKLRPKTYRFRFVNAAVSRPFLVKIKDSALIDVAPRVCHIIATDGGYRSTVISFPTAGLLIGVAERYEIVCDFTEFRSQTLYLWNDRNEDTMKDVPYFCYSHLLAKLEIGATAERRPPRFRPTLTDIVPETPVTRVLTSDNINDALQMADAGEFHREMKFEKKHSQWVINGETWTSFKIAANDIGQNTWEVWRFKTGGGWFHPVHVHLVDLYIIKRIADGGLRPYEVLSPKDVLYLGPSNEVYAIVRFGPHRGDYMFHCHNLIHEDDDMMRAFQVIDTESGKNSESAQPFIVNKFAGIVYANWKYSNPLLADTAAKPTNSWRTLDNTYLKELLSTNIYRIFYPTTSDRELDGFTNPWRSTWCPVR